MRHLAALMILAACTSAKQPAFTPCDRDDPDPCPPGYGCAGLAIGASHCSPYCATDDDCEGRVGDVAPTVDVRCDNAAECAEGEAGCTCSFTGSTHLCIRPSCSVRCASDGDCGHAACVAGFCAPRE
jgi:hypothetical protein